MGIEIEPHMERIQHICCLIENGEAYLEELTTYLTALNRIIGAILSYAANQGNSFFINEEFVVQVLKDIVYGIEHKDSVFLLDVLRYGLLEIYSYTRDELQSEG